MQRSTPSLFRLRTGVRIPPPPAFARVTNERASAWRASERVLSLRKLSRRSGRRPRRRTSPRASSWQASEASGKSVAPKPVGRRRTSRRSPVVVLCRQARQSAGEKCVQYLGLLVQIGRRSCLRTCASNSRYRVYVLESLTSPERHYTGHTSNEMAVRLSWHNQGRSRHTSKYRPWKVIVSMEFCEERVAVAFERYLKSGSGRAFAKRHFSEHSRPPFTNETADTLIGP
jgi:putative endonuclease